MSSDVPQGAGPAGEQVKKNRLIPGIAKILHIDVAEMFGHAWGIGRIVEVDCRPGDRRADSACTSLYRCRNLYPRIWEWCGLGAGGFGAGGGGWGGGCRGGGGRQVGGGGGWGGGGAW